ncbi:MAG TPA: HEPN domain-containing protein [Methylomirabilota bacterium]|nr:HEPN domain-containing protein [Methylomirabilota bacterium]
MLRKQTNASDPKDWFAFGAERLAAADLLHKHHGVTATGIETLQESVERFLKGYLIARGWALVKTHDLPRLLREAAEHEPKFAKYRSFAAELTEDFFAQHYPGEDTTHVGENYEDLRAQAGELIDLIRSGLPHYFSNQDPAA